MIGPIGFLSPWLLAALLALPILWILLRAVPPAPIKRNFPAVALLLGLRDRETTPDRTPWWLLLLRILAIAAAIIAFAGPVLNPTDRIAGKGPLLIGMDASWASAQSWAVRKEKLGSVLSQAEQDGRPVQLVMWSDLPKSDFASSFTTAPAWASRLDAMVPNAWAPDYPKWTDALGTVDVNDIIWFSDGIDHVGKLDFLRTLNARGKVQVLQNETSVYAVTPLATADGTLKTTVLRLDGTTPATLSLSAIGPDPAGIRRRLSKADVEFAIGETTATATFDLPTELRNRVRQVSLDNVASAGAVTITDDGIQRRKVALLSGVREEEGNDLLSPLHFLRKALVTTAEVIEADLGDALLASPDVIILADVGALSEFETEAVTEWVSKGGTLLRFAGPRLIASGIGQLEPHPLLPVRLRAGGRTVGGAMSWGKPRKLRMFDQDSPFFGLTIPDDVSVKSQVVAQPDPDLAERVLAALEDGTPLVTAKPLGEGRVILFHVTASSRWSTLPLSGLFVQMLERLAISARAAALEESELLGLTWTPVEYLDAFGVLRDAQTLQGVVGADLATGQVSNEVRPGLYENGERAVAMNVITANATLSKTPWPLGTSIAGMERPEEQDLKAWFLMAALGLLMIDIFATLVLGGKMNMRKGAGLAVMVIGLSILPATTIDAQPTDDKAALLAANNTVLAYVLTGNARVDEVSRAGLTGISAELFRRTNIEPVPPVGVTPGVDDISLYPFLFWPMSEDQSIPTVKAVDAVNAYLRNGGFIMFDTRDAHLSDSFGGATPNGRKLRQIAGRLDIPRLEPVPQDHVLTRTFYLLEAFPGRHLGRNVWVEAAPEDAAQIEGVPFRNLNDGVTPVLIGGNDWASAWAINDQGRHVFPVGRGSSGELQREYAIRFGVNVLMYVMTGNYKSDQVHVPALLDRLGQ